ncbi:MAG: hypothetical protein ACE5HT_17485 [Gemmatimonadales bacterium]
MYNATLRECERPWGFLLLALCACADLAPAAQDMGGERAAKDLIVSQMASEFGVWQSTAESQVKTEDVLIEPGPPIGTGIQLVRGIPPRDHWHPYLVALHEGTVCPAGGFTSPALSCIAEWLRRGQQDIRPQELARALAVAADQNGGARLITATEATTPADIRITNTWLGHRPNIWPVDTVFATAEGGTVVRVTMLSQQMRSYEQAWRAIAYDFRFDETMNLVAWSRRQSEPFMEVS